MFTLERGSVVLQKNSKGWDQTTNIFFVKHIHIYIYFSSLYVYAFSSFFNFYILLAIQFSLYINFINRNIRSRRSRNIIFNVDVLRPCPQFGM